MSKIEAPRVGVDMPEISGIIKTFDPTITEGRSFFYTIVGLGPLSKKDKDNEANWKILLIRRGEQIGFRLLTVTDPENGLLIRYGFMKNGNTAYRERRGQYYLPSSLPLTLSGEELVINARALIVQRVPENPELKENPARLSLDAI